MYGISSSGKESIANAVETMFVVLAFKLLGNIPKIRNHPSIILRELPKLSLAFIFMQAMSNKEPNHFERDVLKGILFSSFGFIEALKNKTSSNVIEAVDAAVKEAKVNKTYVTTTQINDIISKEMEKAKSHMKLIAEAEATKTRNMGHMMAILAVAANLGVTDPSVFFTVVRDGLTCKECLRLHMMPDGVTPRVYRMADLSMGYHKRGDDRPSACGEHPHCRCTLTQLSPGWGFKGGFMVFKSAGYDEYSNQRSSI